MKSHRAVDCRYFGNGSCVGKGVVSDLYCKYCSDFDSYESKSFHWGMVIGVVICVSLLVWLIIGG